MEIEYFTYPDNSMKDFDKWIEKIKSFLEVKLAMNPDNFVYHDVPKDQRAFYSKKTIDIEYKFPFGQKEL
jgi:glycyl-tRNA synthetase